jgi:uncharacterized protein (DUF488 family)
MSERIITEFINTRKLDDLLKSLKLEKVDMVIDIRWNTYHKSKQGFSPENLKIFLKENDIDYIYIHRLGNPKNFRDKFIRDGFTDFKLLKKAYINYVNGSLTLRSLINLINKDDRKYCLICYCNTLNEEECHRFWLRDFLINKIKNKGLTNVK